ncbi:MAG: hypothetical protein KAS36_00445, partial [Anaerolineales bacterium]|nr:hypothetical protein [Anaerolineales bacterium]
RMVTIFYKWLLGDEVATEGAEEELLDENVSVPGQDDEDKVHYINNLPLLRELTKALPPEPTEEEIPQIVEGGS